MKKSNEAVITMVLQKVEQEMEYITLEELVEFSGFSYFHFHRLFMAYVGESLKQYIKRIRLERSAYELNYKRLTITQVAMNAGYETPSAFNKAFKDFFQTTPSLYKKIEIKVKEYEMIEPKAIVTIEDIEVYALRHMGDYSKVGSAFEVLMKWAYTNKIKHKKNLMGKDAYAYGVSYDDPNVTHIDKLRSDACISNTDKVEVQKGIIATKIREGKYAQFLHKGPYTNLKETYNNIFSSYIKDNDITLRDVPVFEQYLNRDPRRTKPENLKTLIHIPIE